MSPSSSAPLPPALPAPAELLPALLDLLPMGVIYYTPILDAAGAVVDFRFEYLNPAGRRQLHMAAPTTVTFLEQFTEAVPTGAFAFHVDLWAAPEGSTNDYAVSYHADGYDNYFRLNGRRLAQGLLITFTDTADFPRTAAEEALREAQARERSNRQQAEAQRLQVEHLNQELAATNHEYQQTNTALLQAQAFAEKLTHELEARVQARTHEALATAQRLRLLTDALPVLIAYVSPQQQYQFVNEAYRTWFGHAPAALLGRTLREVVGEAAYANARPYIERALAGEALTFEARMPYRPDFVKHIHANFIPDLRDGQVHGFYSLATDITEQVLAREQVQHLNAELQATNAALQSTNARLQHTNVDLDTFVYTASHDLKAPISNIEGLLHALREQLPPAAYAAPEIAHLLALMHESVARFQHTIGHLTDISKLQHAHNEPPEEVDLAAHLHALRLDLAPALAATQAQLSVELGTVRTLRFSPKNLRSILYNLLSNALKYHQLGQPAQVQLRAYRTPGHLIFEVQDHGLGLSPEQQAGLFVMFHRLHTHVEGSGVGLYMVKRIVENAGGTVRVQSEIGVGSTFTVTLPEG